MLKIAQDSLIANNWTETLHPRGTHGYFMPKMGQTQPSKDPVHKSIQDKKTHPNFAKSSGSLNEVAVKMPRVSKYTFSVQTPIPAETTTKPGETESTEQDSTSDFIINSPYIDKLANSDTANRSVSELLASMMECGSEYAWHKKVEEMGISSKALAILQIAGVKICLKDEYKSSGEYDYGTNTITLRKQNQQRTALRFIDEATHALCRFLLGESGNPQNGRDRKSVV